MYLLYIFEVLPKYFYSESKAATPVKPQKKRKSKRDKIFVSIV